MKLSGQDKENKYVGMSLDALGAGTLRDFCLGKKNLQIIWRDPQKMLGYDAVDMKTMKKMIAADAKKALPFCSLQDGLTLVGKCKNSSCQFYKLSVSCNLKYCENFEDQTFEYGRHKEKAICKNCRKTFIPHQMYISKARYI
eukprot:UN30212